MFAGKRFARQLWQQKFCKICTVFCAPKWGWKMDPKMVPEFDPQNGVQKWHPKRGQILAPFLGPFLNLHFGVQNTVQNLQKFLLPKLHGKPFSSKHASQNASVVIAQLVASLNTILYLAKPSKKTKSCDCHKCCTWARWIRASEPDTRLYLQLRYSWKGKQIRWFLLRLGGLLHIFEGQRRNVGDGLPVEGNLSVQWSL